MVGDKPAFSVSQASALLLKRNWFSHALRWVISQQKLTKRWVISQWIDLVGDKPLVCDKPVKYRIGG